MKNRLLSVLIAVTLLLSFIAACNNINPPDETPTPDITPVVTPNVTPTATATAEITPTPKPTPIADLQYAQEAMLTEVLRINIGAAYGEVAYSILEYDDVGLCEPYLNGGPEDILVRDDGSICILDAGNGRILIFNNQECVGSIDVVNDINYTYGAMFDYYDGKFYVLDVFGRTVVVVSDPAITGSQSTETIPLPEEISIYCISSLEVNARGILIREKEDYIKPHGETGFELDPAPNVSYFITDHRNVRIGSNVWTLYEKASESFYILGVDANENLYVEAFDGDESNPHSKVTVRAFDKNGNIRGYAYAYVDIDDWIEYSYESMTVASDGTVYVMHCLKGYVLIQKVTLG